MRLIEFLLPIMIVDVGLLVVLVEPQGKVCPTLTREEQIQGSIDPRGISSITCGSDLRLLCKWTINTTNCEYGVYYRFLYSNITDRICGQKIPTEDIVYRLTPSQTGRIVMTTTYTTGYVSGEAILIVKNFQSEDEGTYRCEIETNLLRRDVAVDVTCLAPSSPVPGISPPGHSTHSTFETSTTNVSTTNVSTTNVSTTHVPISQYKSTMATGSDPSIGATGDKPAALGPGRALSISFLLIGLLIVLSAVVLMALGPRKLGVHYRRRFKTTSTEMTNNGKSDDQETRVIQNEASSSVGYSLLFGAFLLSALAAILLILSIAQKVHTTAVILILGIVVVATGLILILMGFARIWMIRKHQLSLR